MSTPRTTRRPTPFHRGITVHSGVTALGVATLASVLLPTLVIGAAEPQITDPAPQTAKSSIPANQAEIVLESFGLSRHQSRWLTTEEAALKADLPSLRRLERQYHQTRSTLRREVGRASQLRAQVIKSRDEVDQLNQLLDGGGLAGRRYNAAVDEVNRRADFINQHVALLASPLGAVMEPAVVKQAQALIGLYGQLSALLARSSQTLDGLDDRYAELAANQAIRDALDEMDDGGQLGPAGDYRTDRRRLKRLAKSLWSDELPLAIVDNQPLMPVVLGERAFGVFALSSEQGFSLISSELAEAVGAHVDTSAQPSRLQAFGAGDYELFPAKIESVRLGRHSAQDITFMVLPPEADEVISVLDLGLLTGLDVQLDLPNLTARVREVRAVDKAALEAENR